MIPILPAHAFLPVIHVIDGDQALRNAKIAFENGAHGIFLISHERSVRALDLLRVHRALRKQFPSAWIGINFLDLVPEQIFGFLTDDVSGLWVDDIGMRFKMGDALAVMERRHHMRREWNGLYFGGVAFKHQPILGAPDELAVVAAPFVDVVTTSGVKTGSPPSVQKIRRMHEAVPNKLLAIASGITPENVQDFLPFANHFLVATGVSDSFTELNPLRVRMCADIVRSVD